jgi:hypothetical protein
MSKDDKLTIDSKLGDLLKNPETRAIIEKHMGKLVKDKRVMLAKGLSFRKVLKMAPKGLLPEGAAEGVEADLQKYSEEH